MKNKDLSPIGIYLFLFFIFNSFFEYILSKALTSSFLNIYIYNSTYPSMTLLVIPILLFLFIFYISCFTFSNKFNDLLFFSIILSILIRIKTVANILTEHDLVLYKVPIILIFVTSLIIYILYRYYRGYRSKNNNGKKLNIIDPDKAILLIEDNKRDDFLHLINNFEDIIKQHNNDSLSLAITGEWGSGKTSFINMLKIKLEKTNNYKIINFYPWRCENPESITITFFNLLADTFDNINQRKNVKKYLTLIGAETNTALRSLLLLFGSNNQNNIYDLISSELKKSKKKIIVFIDDVDRLEKNEILSVLKILRNAENFDNIIFITALDEKYVRKTIKKPESYIERFFQYKRFIPPINYKQKNEILIKLFESTIKPIIKNDAIIDKYLDALMKQRQLDCIYSPTRKDLSLTYYLTNIREMKKFISKLTITIKQLKSLADIIKSLKDYNSDTFNFKFLDASILNEDQIIILTMILIKYSHLIRFEQSYLDNLKNAIINQKTKEEHSQENPETSQNNFSITEFNEIFKNPEIICLFSLLFKGTYNESRR